MDRGPDPGTPEQDAPAAPKHKHACTLRPATSPLFLLLLVVIQASSCLCCKVDHCTREYQMELGEHGVQEPGPSDAFCLVLRKYGDCIRSTARSCRGNLKYHSTFSLVSNWIVEYNCSSHDSAAAGMRPSYSATAPPSHDLPCTFRGLRRYRHCGLSGDPHLKTFHNEYMTCKIKGAWPLIDNPYLAVQVTNEPVAEGSPATATTKVTIIIKSRGNTDCTSEKTYEATGDVPLPTAFIDGSRRSGPAEAVSLTVADGGSRVEIRLRHVDATLVVRRLGKYLAFSARMPEEVVKGSRNELQEPGLPETNSADVGGWGEGLQLCIGGCPASERLETIPGNVNPQIPIEAAEERCRMWNLTDHYLDWCVFDSLTAPNDIDLAAAAAYAALADVNRLDPDGAALALKNRTAATRMTAPPRTAQSSGESLSSSSQPTRASVSLLAFLLLLGFLFKQSQQASYSRRLCSRERCVSRKWDERTMLCVDRDCSMVTA